jgi:hypothetical protein
MPEAKAMFRAFLRVSRLRRGHPPKLEKSGPSVISLAGMNSVGPETEGDT